MLCRILFGLFLLTFFPADAQEPTYVHAKGHACEDIKAGENKSSVRAKVTDKAGFDAVSHLDLLQKYQNNFNEHDFNVMVYELIDGVLEGVSVQTISEDDNRICVELNAMAQEAGLREEIGKYLKERGSKAPTDIAIEAVEEVIAKKEKSEDIAPVPQKNIDELALVFVAPTTFYNGAVSENHSKLFKHYLSSGENFYITDSQDIADFVVYPRVEKARMDESQDGTKRLQMQITFRLVSSDGKEIAKDEQNRAIICDEEKTEQQNAQELLKKMFAKSAKRIAVEIEKNENK